jgi:hypothetical protein
MWNVLPYTNKSVDFTREGVADYGSFRQVQYFVTIQRKATYYIWVIIAPTYIISALSIAGIFAPFSNGGERQEKVSFFFFQFFLILLRKVASSHAISTVNAFLGHAWLDNTSYISRHT